MSAKWSTFNVMFNKVTSKLKNESKIDEISKEFGILSTDRDRASYVLSLPAVQEFIQPAPLTQQKSIDHSVSFKATGNTAYRASEYRDSVQLYTDSIAWAPLLSDGGEDALSLAYGNRSAALYQLQQFEACIRDIDRAINEKYPARLLHKVLHRKGMCCLQLQRFEIAEELFRSAIAALEDSDLKEKQKQNLKAEIHDLICKSGKNESLTENGVIDPLKEIQTLPSMPSTHSQYLSLSSACTVDCSDKEGRFIVAARDIVPGELVLIEQPFASVLVRSNYSFHCHHCLRYCLDAIPCVTCPDARFCSEECRSTAMETYHQYECTVLNTLHHSQIDKFGCLALRTITKQSYASLKEFEVQDLPLNGCNADGLYAQQNYNPIVRLVTHAEDRPVQDLFHRTVTAVYLLKLLQHTSYFEGKDLDEAYVAGLLLSHLQSFPCNAHEVPELYLDPNSIDVSMPNELGAGIYGTLSLFNHSCDPGVNRNFYGDTCVVRAIKIIRKGEQVSDNYGAVYATHNLKKRQEKLRPQYFFTCQCEPCTTKWPLYQDINIDTFQYKCSECQKPLKGDACCGLDYNTEEMHDEFTTSEVEFRAAFQDLLACRVGKAFLVFQRHLALIQRMIVLPWRQFNDCQEALKQCYSIMGNCNTSSSLLNGNIF